MIDMTDKKENQKDFITNILLDTEGTNYYVIYADGRIEKNKFDIESYNEVLLKMEKEFFHYKESYTKRINKERLINSAKVIITDLITTIASILAYNIDIEESLKVACVFIVVLNGILAHQSFNQKVQDFSLDLEEVDLMDELIKRKEEFTTEIIDPETGKTKKWYVVNLSNIYTIRSTASLNNYTKEENKLKKIPNFLKRNCETSDAR